MNRKILTTALVLLATTASAEVYSWRDANGVVHYGDKPGSENAQIVEIQTSRTNRAVVQERYTARQDQLSANSSDYQEQQAAAKAEADAAKLSADERASACQKARDTLRNYINARRLYRTDEKDQRVYLKAAEINSARETAEQNVADKCR